MDESSGKKWKKQRETSVYIVKCLRLSGRAMHYRERLSRRIYIYAVTIDDSWREVNQLGERVADRHYTFKLLVRINFAASARGSPQGNYFTISSAGKYHFTLISLDLSGREDARLGYQTYHCITVSLILSYAMIKTQERDSLIFNVYRKWSNARRLHKSNENFCPLHFSRVRL